MPATDTRERLSQQQLCERLDLSERQVRNLLAAGLPRLPASGGRDRFGEYPWPRVLHWYVAFKIREFQTRALRYAERRERTARATRTSATRPLDSSRSA